MSQHPDPEDWTSILHLMTEEDCPAERIVAVLLQSGVFKMIALGQSAKASHEEVRQLCMRIEEYVYLCRSTEYDDRVALLDMQDPSCSRFAIYGWPVTALPKELRMGDGASERERRLDQAIQLGFDPNTGHAETGTTLEEIAKKMGMSRQALTKSLEKALKERADRRRGGSIIPL